MTDSIEAQARTVTDLGTKQSKVTKEISKTLETQNSQQKDANTTLAEQKKIMQEQEAEIKKVTRAVDNQTGVLQKNAGGWKMLMTGFAIKFASEVVDGFKSIISTGLEVSRVYEDMSARLTPLVGDLETAQKNFWSLNGLEDETATATDKLAKAFVDLGNNGLTNSNEQLKTYATIAHGTGRDINTLTDAVIAFSQGSTKALRQFGITAKDNGAPISLTYKGSTTEIEKNSKALDEYLSNLARNNFDGVMEAKLNTVSAATGRLDNVWGTFCTRLMQSDGGFGELIIMGNDFLANTLNGICRKVVVFMLVGIASILDTRIFQTRSVLRTAVIFFYLSNEGISLLENAAHLGLPIPTVVRKALNQLHDKSENKENENGK